MQQVFQCYRCGAQNYVGQPACWNCQSPFQWNCPNCKAQVQNAMASCPTCHVLLPWPKHQNENVYNQSQPNISSRTPDIEAIEWNRKGLDYYLDNPKKAIQCYDKAIKISANYDEAWSNKGAALRILRNYEEAIQCCDTALSIKPYNITALFNKAVSLDKVGRSIDALMLFNRALEINQLNDDIWIEKCRILYSLSRYEEIIHFADCCISLNPNCAEMWVAKGTAFQAIGRQTDAGVCLDRAKLLM